MLRSLEPSFPWVHEKTVSLKTRQISCDTHSHPTVTSTCSREIVFEYETRYPGSPPNRRNVPLWVAQMTNFKNGKNIRNSIRTIYISLKLHQFARIVCAPSLWGSSDFRIVVTRSIMLSWICSFDSENWHITICDVSSPAFVWFRFVYDQLTNPIMQTCCQLNLSIRIVDRRIKAPPSQSAQSLSPAVVTVRERYIGKAVVCVHICRTSNVSCKFYRSLYQNPSIQENCLYQTQKFVLLAHLFELNFSANAFRELEDPWANESRFCAPTIQLIITAAWTLSGHQRRGAEQVPHLHWRRLSLLWPGKGEERHRGQVPRFCQGNLSFCWVQVGRRVPEQVQRDETPQQGRRRSRGVPKGGYAHLEGESSPAGPRLSFLWERLPFFSRRGYSESRVCSGEWSPSDINWFFAVYTLSIR